MTTALQINRTAPVILVNGAPISANALTALMELRITRVLRLPGRATLRFDDAEALGALADRFVQKEFKAGDVLTEAGKEADEIYLIAHGKVQRTGKGKYGDQTVLDVLADGDYYSYQAILESKDYWQFTAKAMTAATVLVLKQAGPKGGPGMPEWGAAPVPARLLKAGVKDMVRISDARMSGTSYGTVVLHVTPESAVCPGLISRGSC